MSLGPTVDPHCTNVVVLGVRGAASPAATSTSAVIATVAPATQTQMTITIRRRVTKVSQLILIQLRTPI